MTTTTIIVVESDRLLRTAIAEYLKRQGYCAVEVAEAKPALQHLEQGNIQAMLLDTHPAAEGTDLLKQIRNRPTLAQLPVLALIASQGSLEALDYLQPGDYLSLPFEMEHLALRLKRLLAGSTAVLAVPSELVPACPVPPPEPLGGQDDGAEMPNG
jgi:DNA-binding response OmpR family regulator